MTTDTLLLSTGDISRRLGFTISKPFICDVLGVDRDEGMKAGSYWTEESFKRICFNLAVHIKKAHDGEFAPVREVKPRKPKEDASAGQGGEESDPLFGDDETEDESDPLFAEG
jgi:hypothetical protein